MATNNFEFNGTMENVVSSNIEAIGHDPETNVMKIRFMNGTEYVYANVPKEVVSSIKAAPSVGRYFSDTVKKDPITYPYKRV